MGSWHRKTLGLLGAALIGCVGTLAACSPAPDTTATTDEESAARDRDPSVLRLLYSRAPVTLNPHFATGVQDFEAGRIVFEPLASADAEGNLVPILAAEIPTVENGGVAADGLSVTWRLKPDLQWADGTPLTAEDVVFTYELVTNPQIAAATAQYYEAIATVEAIANDTVRITFKAPTAAWQIPFTGQTGVILPQHQFAAYSPAEVRDADLNQTPIGTGPYRVTAFQPGSVIYEPNPNYRGGVPAFQRVELVGGLAPYAAAREVLETGTADFAHNLQIEAEILTELQTSGAGKVVPVFGGLVERIMLNPTDPNAETESGERASLAAPHPFLSDVRVRRAIAHAIDRDAIAETLYGFTGRPTDHLFIAPQVDVASTEVIYDYDLDQARALLEAAGWQDTNDNGIRDRNGVEMRLVFQSSVNPVRQQTQTLVRDSLREIGIEVEIKRVRVDDFFSADPEQTNSINHFYADMQAYTTGNDHPDPTIYLNWWTCDQIAAQDNNWQKPNNARYCNETYDALWQSASQELDRSRRIALIQQMDALLSEDVAAIPIVHRAIANGVSTTLIGMTPTPWDTSTWDIAQWQRQSPTPDPETAQPEAP